MKEIKLIGEKGKGLSALVDDEDFDRISRFRWRAIVKEYTIYPMRSTTRKEQTEMGYPTGIRMSREVMGVMTDKSVLVDHEDHNGLNNQQYNLRVCSGTQNQGNRNKIKKCSSIYKGVYFIKSRNDWGVALRQKDVRLRKTSIKSEHAAALIYNKWAVKYFGEYAKLNILIP